MIIGSDGIWEFISSQAACELVHGAMVRQKETADKAVRLLIERSSIAWKTSEGDYRDDITGLVVSLPIFEPAEESHAPVTPGFGTKF